MKSILGRQLRSHTPRHPVNFRCSLPSSKRWGSISTDMAENESADSKPPEDSQKLPKLSLADFHTYNQMAEHMDYFHNHFRQQWTLMYDACAANKRPANMSIRQFINVGLQFCRYLGMHHSIEEAHIFPILAQKMPAFREELQLLTHHKRIHAGLDNLEAYLEECLEEGRELRLEELKAVMDTFGGVLWEHLEAEVKELGAENMRKYWTLDEMRRMPM